MAIRIAAATGALSRLTNIPPRTGCTVMGWGRIITDRNNYSTFYSAGTATGGEHSMQTSNDGTTLNVWNGTTEVTGTNMVVGRWYHMAMVMDPTNLTVYLNGVQDCQVAANGLAFTGCRFGNTVAGGDFLNGNLFGWKMWNQPLTRAEVRTEIQQVAPVRLASLNSWFAFDNPATMLLEGGRYKPGRVEYALTSTGAITYEDSPLVPFIRNRHSSRNYWDVPTAATGTGASTSQFFLMFP